MRFIYPATAGAALLLAASANAATTYTGWQSTIKYSKTATAATGFKNGARITTQVIYDPATDTYTLRDTGSPTLKSSFAPADIDAGASDATFTVYEKVSGSTTETFRLLNQSPTNPLIVLSYVDYGQWRRATTSSGTTSINDTYVVFGTKTARGDMPHSGTGTYTTVLDGTYVKADGSYVVSGTGTLDAFFYTGLIGYTATATATPETTGVGFSFGTMTGDGSIAFNSATFKGTGNTNGSGYKLDVNGGFYGPGAAEIGGVFTLKGNGGNGTGAIVGN
jgi:hypothetical protein